MEIKVKAIYEGNSEYTVEIDDKKLWKQCFKPCKVLKFINRYIIKISLIAIILCFSTCLLPKAFCEDITKEGTEQSVTQETSEIPINTESDTNSNSNQNTNKKNEENTNSEKKENIVCKVFLWISIVLAEIICIFLIIFLIKEDSGIRYEKLDILRELKNEVLEIEDDPAAKSIKEAGIKKYCDTLAEI